MEHEKVPVTMRALVQRINRRLASESQCLKKARGKTAMTDLGAYYVLHYGNNTIVALKVNVPALAQDLGALKPWEALEEE